MSHTIAGKGYCANSGSDRESSVKESGVKLALGVAAGVAAVIAVHVLLLVTL